MYVKLECFLADRKRSEPVSLVTGNHFAPVEPPQQDGLRDRARSGHVDVDTNIPVNLGTYPRRPA
jgi:hypothetical protein